MKRMVLVTLNILLLLQAGYLYARDTDSDAKNEGFLQENEKKQMHQLADKLESCEVFTQKIVHPFTEKLMERKIAGLSGAKCLYIEEMPNNGKMECKYSEELRKAVAQLYRNTANAEDVRSNVKASLSTDGQYEVEAKYFIDGKEVEDPLQEAMNNGTCVISGY